MFNIEEEFCAIYKEITTIRNFQLKNVHFQLQRENAGLRSQLESIFENMKEEVRIVLVNQ